MAHTLNTRACTHAHSGNSTGDWWFRRNPQQYLPVVPADDEGVANFLKVSPLSSHSVLIMLTTTQLNRVYNTTLQHHGWPRISPEKRQKVAAQRAACEPPKPPKSSSRWRSKLDGKAAWVGAALCPLVQQARAHLQRTVWTPVLLVAAWHMLSLLQCLRRGTSTARRGQQHQQRGATTKEHND